MSIDYLASALEEDLLANVLLTDASLHRLKGSVVVSLPSDTLVPASEVGLTEAVREALFRMGEIIASIANRIDVRGHIDPATMTEGSYALKWTISLAHAFTFINELWRTGYWREIAICGLAVTRFNHLDEQISESASFVLGRWMDVVVNPHSGNI